MTESLKMSMTGDGKLDLYLDGKLVKKDASWDEYREMLRELICGSTNREEEL